MFFIKLGIKKNKLNKSQSTSKLISLLCLVFMGILFVFGHTEASSGINKQISYQGQLTDNLGNAKADGNYSMIISLYTGATGGTPVWTARGTTATPTARTVALVGGIFSIMLGDTVAGDNALTTIDFSQDAYYLGITVGSDAEMTPRKRIGSVPQAFNANNLVGDGFIRIAGVPTGNTVDTGTVYVNPATATSGYTLLGLAVGGVQKFKIDEGGNLALSGKATVSTLGTTNTNNLLCQNSSNQLAACNTIGVAQGGTGTATAFTQGSVIFAGASGIYSQDNSGLFWDATNKSLGLGTNSLTGAKFKISEGTGSIFDYYNDTSKIASAGFSTINAGKLQVMEVLICSDATACGDKCSFNSLVYGTVLGADGKCWMDRNLGATQVATSATDSNAYGWLYQWGRGTDGHQIISSNSTAGPSSSVTPGALFFTMTSSDNWYNGSNPTPDNLWQGLSGVNNPCPAGFRLPTQTDWTGIMSAMNFTSCGSNCDNALASSVLHLTTAGIRTSDYATVNRDGVGRYWSSTTSGTNAIYSIISAGGISTNSNYSRTNGSSIRCIQGS